MIILLCNYTEPPAAVCIIEHIAAQWGEICSQSFFELRAISRAFFTRVFVVVDTKPCELLRAQPKPLQAQIRRLKGAPAQPGRVGRSTARN